MIQNLCVLAGPGSESDKEEVAKALRVRADVDVLICAAAGSLDGPLQRYAQDASFSLLLLYSFPAHPDGWRGAERWSKAYIASLDSETRRRVLKSLPRVEVKISQDSGELYLKCNWNPVRADQLRAYLGALDSVFAEADWRRER